MNNKYSNDDLGIIYLMGKKTDYLDFLYKTEFEECYLIDKDIYLFKNKDKDRTDFKIINVNYVRCCNEPIGEVRVDPKNASITFFSHYLSSNNDIIRVKYDDLEKNWDVRTNINGKEKLTDLNKALRSLHNLDSFGTEIQQKFIEIIDSSKKVFNKSMENKLIR